MGWLSFEGTGILNLLFRLLSSQGKAVLHKRTLTINYKKISLDNYIINFIIDLQFLNKSKQQTFATDFYARFYDGETWYELLFDGNVNPPAEKLEAKSPKDIQLRLLPLISEMRLPLLAIYDNTAHLSLRYKISDKEDTVFIHDIRMIEDQSGYSWVAM